MPLHLLPNLLGPHVAHRDFFPTAVDTVVAALDGLIAENEKNGRAYLKRFSLKTPLQEFKIFSLNEHTPHHEIEGIIPELQKGEWGLISDAGLPCVADPGFSLVQLCHHYHIPVSAQIGPSSIILGIMLSGLPCQRFTFHGYISKKEEERKKDLFVWEQLSKKECSTQIFIETPYRNRAVLNSCIHNLSPKTQLSVLWDATLSSQGQITKKIADWKQMKLPEIDKKPAIFLFFAYS